MVKLTRARVSVTAAINAVMDKRCGAVVCFLGTVRQDRYGRAVVRGLNYEGYRAMAFKALNRIGKELKRLGARRWALVHRLGRLRQGEVSVVVAVSAPHRHEAFKAGRYAIDRIKRTVPIWKAERLGGGKERWVRGLPLLS